MEVGGGILMPKGGQITAEEHVMAKLATNTRVTGTKEVIINNEINHCLILPSIQVPCTKGKRIIHGWGIVYGQGLKYNELGSALGVTTVVGVGIRINDDQKALAESRTPRRRSSVSTPVGRYTQAFLEKSPPKEREYAIKLVRYWAKKF